MNVRYAEVHEAIDVIRVGDAERYRRFIGRRAAADDISTLIVGGYANVRPIAKLQYDSVPAPEFDVRSTWLALTLLLSMLAMLRGRRPIPTR